MSGPDAALAVCRVVHDAATMLLWGAYAYLAVLVPRGLGHAVGRRLDPLRIGAVALAIGTTAAILPAEVAAIGDGWSDIADGDAIWAVLTGTSVGWAWQARAVAALLLATTLAAPAAARPAATAAAAGLLLATLALTGHAVMQGGWRGVVHRLDDVLHVLAAGAWVGALVPLLVILRGLDDAARRADTGLALRRFSLAGHGTVALVIATGIGNAVLILGWHGADLSLPYQRLLAAKVVLVAVMTALALVNRYVLVPRMARARDPSVRQLRLGTIAEIALGLAVIACVGVFGLLDPG